MTRRYGRAGLRSDTRGATLVEFALVAPVMLLMLMGFFDLAHQAYAKAVLQGAVQKAARDATLEDGPANNSVIDQRVTTQMERITGPRATFESERLSYADFSDVGTPENFTDASPFNNQYDTGECFEDVNGNGSWDADVGRSGQGGAEDAVLYRMTVEYPRLFPMASMLGWNPNQEIRAETVLRNQPYAEQVVPVVAGC